LGSAHICAGVRIGVEIDNKGECKGSLNASLPESETELRTA